MHSGGSHAAASFLYIHEDMIKHRKTLQPCFCARRKSMFVLLLLKVTITGITFGKEAMFLIAFVTLFVSRKKKINGHILMNLLPDVCLSIT